MSRRNAPGGWLRVYAARYYPGALLLLALAGPVTATAGSITYDTFAGSVGGYYDGVTSGNYVGNYGGSGVGCTGAAPVPLAVGSFSTGFYVPSGGVQPCNYYGGTIQNVTSTGQFLGAGNAATGNVSGTFNSGQFAYSGNAEAFANSTASAEIHFGGEANGTLTSVSGYSEGGSISASGFAAAIDDPYWVVNCTPSGTNPCSPGETYYAKFNWFLSDIDVSTNQNPANPYGSFSLEIQSDLNNGGIFNPFFVDYNGSPGLDPTVNCPGQPAGCGYDIYAGGFSGNSTFTFAPDISAQSVTLGAGGSATVDAQFSIQGVAYNTTNLDPDIGLIGVTWEDGGGNPVTGITLTTSEGIYFDDGTYQSDTPEPASWLLCALGLGAVTVRIFRTGRA